MRNLSKSKFHLFSLVDQLVHGTFGVSNLISLKLGVGHEHYRGKHDKHHLEGPESHVRNWRESIETHILTTGLICIAFEVSLNDSVNFACQKTWEVKCLLPMVKREVNSVRLTLSSP